MYIIAGGIVFCIFWLWVFATSRLDSFRERTMLWLLQIFIPAHSRMKYRGDRAWYWWERK